jgi:hypothetical protein
VLNKTIVDGIVDFLASLSPSAEVRKAAAHKWSEQLSKEVSIDFRSVPCDQQRKVFLLSWETVSQLID